MVSSCRAVFTNFREPMKAISARATYNPQVIDRLFGTPAARRTTFRAIIAAQEKGEDRLEAHGLVLTRRRITIVQPPRS